MQNVLIYFLTVKSNLFDFATLFLFSISIYICRSYETILQKKKKMSLLTIYLIGVAPYASQVQIYVLTHEFCQLDKNGTVLYVLMFYQDKKLKNTHIQNFLLLFDFWEFRMLRITKNY